MDTSKYFQPPVISMDAERQNDQQCHPGSATTRGAVEIAGADLTIAQIVEVARLGRAVALPRPVLDRIAQARELFDAALRRGDRIYGASTSVGPKTTSVIDIASAREFNRRLLRTHNVGHGPTAAPDVVRATMLVALNAMASGRVAVRPLLAQRLADALNQGTLFDLHVRGSMGQGDMAPLSEMAIHLFGEEDLVPGEALALLNSSALSTGAAALALADLQHFFHLSTLAGALSMEGFAANPSIVSEIALESRPFRGAKRHGRALRSYLEGSYLFASGGPRNHQDPLCFRSLPIVHGVADDSLEFAMQQVSLELNSSQGNPVISLERGGLAAVANFDSVSLCMALDVARLAMAPVVTSSAERVAKLVDATWSGLPVGLIVEDGVGAPGFNGYAMYHKSIASEARLLTAPLAGELASSSHSNSVLDRTSMAGLAARRTAELAELFASIVGIELLVAAQAVDMRARRPLGAATARLHGLVRSAVPFAAAGDRPPKVDPLLARIGSEQTDLIRLMREGAM
jgi:histidine ammonia-lyase